MLRKSIQNPILQAQPDLAWANQKVYNAAAIYHDGAYQLYFRAIGDDYISRIGRATSQDGVNFSVDPLPVFGPLSQCDQKGCEDPRITKVGDRYIMAYTAYDGLTARVAITTSSDLVHWSDRTIAFPDWKTGRWVDPAHSIWNKAAALFPQKINGTYWLLFGDDDIWQASSEDLVHWSPISQPVLAPRPGYFDASYVEMGPPPLLTEYGWLILYHGIDGRDNGRVYRIGAALADSNDPSKIIWRSNEPILEPTELFERIGQIDIIDGGMERLEHTGQAELERLAATGSLPQAIFCCGAVLRDGRLNIYYSGGDTVLCLATGRLADIIPPTIAIAGA